jgi:Tfp pilus assembly protein PilF
MRLFPERLLLLGGLCFALSAAAEELSLTNLLAKAELHDKKGETDAALKAYLEADKFAPDNAEILCSLAKQYCDSMHLDKDRAHAKDCARKALACALRSVQADPKSPKSHVCVAVCLAKNFPYSDNQTRVDYSRQIKAEAEKAIALDPKFDLSYHMLGRWHCEVANMNLFMRAMVKIAYGGLPKASHELAIQNFKKAIELSPDRIIHHLQLAKMYHLTGKENLMTDELKQCGVLSPMDLDDQDAQNIAKKILQDHKWPEEM